MAVMLDHRRCNRGPPHTHLRPTLPTTPPISSHEAIAVRYHRRSPLQLVLPAKTSTSTPGRAWQAPRLITLRNAHADTPRPRSRRRTRASCSLARTLSTRSPTRTTFGVEATFAIAPADDPAPGGAAPATTANVSPPAPLAPLRRATTRGAAGADACYRRSRVRAAAGDDGLRAVCGRHCGARRWCGVGPAHVRTAVLVRGAGTTLLGTTLFYIGFLYGGGANALRTWLRNSSCTGGACARQRMAGGIPHERAVS